VFSVVFKFAIDFVIKRAEINILSSSSTTTVSSKRVSISVISPISIS
jgi:hypothetical protein